MTAVLYEVIDKLRLTVTDWNQIQTLGAGYTDIDAVKINWLQFAPPTAGNTELIIKIAELGNAGTKFIPNQTGNAKYFFSLPIDQAAYVTNTYSNFSDVFDKTFRPKLEGLNQLSFDIRLNSTLANMSVSNPLEMEISLYRRIK